MFDLWFSCNLNMFLDEPFTSIIFYKFLPSVTSRNCIQLQQIIMKDGIAHVYEILQFYKLSHITSTLLQQKMCVTLNVDNKTQKKKTKTYL